MAGGVGDRGGLDEHETDDPYEKVLKGVPPRTRMWVAPGFVCVFVGLIAAGFLAGVEAVADHPLIVGPVTVLYWPVAITWARRRSGADTNASPEDSQVRPQDRMRVWAVVAATAVLAGLGGWLGLVRAQALERSGARAVGVLVRVQDDAPDGSTLTVRFVPVGSGSPEQFEQVVFDALDDRRGHRVNVAYDPANPRHARVVGRWPSAADVLIPVGIIGGAISLPALALNAAATRRARDQ
ncbi:DUF3592 domain-containing protein [Actinopolymorpha rutila]|uniref:DUF3592 domain-containing protein n=1 Tax=Actinopolymorpha rutila TaxID=446787 RepID=A0A852ZLC5_9ACTN|nr:DUF3592 domain-containing protein [Actinopolymorpha rutila]NYH92925.1 hypothetical protein [Actinopolymorpha rutila]